MIKEIKYNNNANKANNNSNNYKKIFSRSIALLIRKSVKNKGNIEQRSQCVIDHYLPFKSKETHQQSD